MLYINVCNKSSNVIYHMLYITKDVRQRRRRDGQSCKLHWKAYWPLQSAHLTKQEENCCLSSCVDERGTAALDTTSALLWSLSAVAALNGRGWTPQPSGSRFFSPSGISPGLSNDRGFFDSVRNGYISPKCWRKHWTFLTFATIWWRLGCQAQAKCQWSQRRQLKQSGG